MKLAFYIARRYLISKKSVNVINIISGISVAGVCTATVALVIVLSVMNGLHNLIFTSFSSFDSNLKITATEGKSFDPTDLDAIRNLPGVASFTEVIEESALLVYNQREYPAIVKGVPDNYDQIIGLDSLYVTEGKFILNKPPHQFAVVGEGIAWYLSMGLNFTNPVEFYAPKKGVSSSLDFNNAFSYDYLYAAGIFSVHQEVDSKYILVPFDFARRLFQMENTVNAVEIQVNKGVEVDDLQQKIKEILGARFDVKNQHEQHQLIYQVVESEKWYVYLIFGFILIIASFNILSSLSMLIIDKKQDIAILRSMGADSKLVRRIFVLEGWLISILGALIGIVLGSLLVWMQDRFELVKLPGDAGTYLLSSYPVQLQLNDLVLVFALVAGIGFLASWYPVQSISGKYLPFDQD